MQISRQNSNLIQIDAVSLFTRQMKRYRFENAPLLAAFSNRPCFGNGGDRCDANRRRIASKTMRLQMKPRSCKRYFSCFLVLSVALFLVEHVYFSLSVSLHASLYNILKVQYHSAPVAQLVEHRAVMREVVSSTPAGKRLRVLK